MDPEAKVERDYQELQTARSRPTVLPYEERVAAWVEERERAMKRRPTPPGRKDGP